MGNAKAMTLAVLVTLGAAGVGCVFGEGLSRLTASGKGSSLTSSLGPGGEDVSGMDGRRMLLGPVAAPTSNPSPDKDAPNRGKALYTKSCMMCHAADGTGVAHLGTNLTISPMVTAGDLTAIAAVIRTGRTADDPNNKSGLPMPAKGGNTMMKEKQIIDVAAYVKTLAKK